LVEPLILGLQAGGIDLLDAATSNTTATVGDELADEEK